MQIRLVDYKEGEPKDVAASYDPKSLDLEFVDWKYQEPLALEGTVEKGPDTLSFKGSLKSRVELLCGRCLKSIQRPMVVPFDLYFEIRGREFVETTDELRELLLLEHPLAFVCSENCKGLCPQCGINLNERACSCNRGAGSQSLSQLGSVIKNRKGKN